MAYVAMDKLLDKSCDSIYKLVILASKRALEIAEGQPKLVVASSDMKPSSVALLEIAQDKIECRKIKHKE